MGSHPLCPKEHYVDPAKMGSLMLVNKWLATDTWLQVDPSSSDHTGVQLWTEMGNMLIINTYNEGVTSHNNLMTFADQLWPSSELSSHH